jgi:hypothetical protein
MSQRLINIPHIICDIVREFIPQEDYDSLISKLEPSSSLDALKNFLAIFAKDLDESVGSRNILNTSAMTARMMFNYVDFLKTFPAPPEFDQFFWSSEQGKHLLSLLPLVKAQERVSMVDPVSTLTEELASSGFMVRHLNSEAITSAIIKFANKCLQSWYSTGFYSPYAAVVNASMMGKSRAFRELPNSGIFIISICLQKPSATNKPSRSPAIADWFINYTANVDVCELAYCAFVARSLEALATFVSEQPADLTCAELALAWSRLQSEWQFWRSILSRCETAGLSKSDFKSLAFNSQQNLKASLNGRAGLPKGSVRVLFFFDEASQLLDNSFNIADISRFHLLRRALQILPEAPEASVFAFFTDTVSEISSLAPSRRWDPSMKARIKRNSLFPVFWWLPTMDIWPECKEYHRLRDLERPRLFSVYGRPGIHSGIKAVQGGGSGYLSEIDSNKKTGDAEVILIDSLEAKLLPNGDPWNITIEDSLAILGVLTALTVTASCQAASALIASHMRQCVGVSPDRESIYSYQYPEPALALAAMRLTAMIGWGVMIDGVRDAMSLAFTDAGHRGEIGGQILLLMAAERCMTILNSSTGSKVNIPAIPLEMFLFHLLGAEAYTSVALDLQFQERISRMYVRIVQFVQFFCRPDRQQVTQMFNRACGIVCEVGAPFVDLILPIFVLKDGENLDDAVVLPDQMSTLLVQVKCYSRTPSVKQMGIWATSHLPRKGSANGMNSLLDYVSLVLEVGTGSVQFDCHTYPQVNDGRQISVAAVGIRPSRILDPDTANIESIDESFEKMLKAKVDPLKVPGSTAESLKNLSASISLVYKQKF